jgi:hypothetical protein
LLSSVDDDGDDNDEDDGDDPCSPSDGPRYHRCICVTKKENGREFQ